MTGPQTLQGQEVVVPGDISSAAFFLTAGAIMPESEIVLKNVGINPTRTGILDVLEEMGASIAFSNQDDQNQSADLTVQSSTLQAVTIAGDCVVSHAGAWQNGDQRCGRTKSKRNQPN